jgi:hypothetical protein
MQIFRRAVYNQISQTIQPLTRKKLIIVLMLNRINKLFYVVLLGMMKRLEEYERAQEFLERAVS